MKTTKNIVLITGTTSGIGLALTKRFLKNNNFVIGAAKNQNQLKDFKENNKNFDYFVCDLSEVKQVQSLVNFINEKYPTINILINNAGVEYNYLLENNAGNIKKIITETQIDFVSPMILCNELIPVLKNKKESAIVNVTSGLGNVAKKTAATYSGCKAGMQNFTIALRMQLKNTSIKIFDLNPSLVDTPLTAGRGEKIKISPERLVDEFWAKFQENKFQIDIEKVKLLKTVKWISPKLASWIINKDL